uniref:WD repeat domain phosphoinositide-interacting protein 2 n=1 Tax=Elaeophora elaphi TaxID=1147741 RepID=A0A0R3RV92_9BILA
MAESLPGTSAETSAQDETDPQFIFINFSRSVDRLITGGDYGFTIYKTRIDDDTPLANDVILVESFPPVHKFGVVFGDTPHKLLFYDAFSRSWTSSTHFSQKILNVKACTSYNYEDLECYARLIVHPAPPNFSLLMDLTGDEKPRLVYPDSETEGIVAIQNICVYSHSKNVINAHNHPIGALRLNNTATLLATTSNVATVIRLYDARTTECLVVFRRGVARSVIVHSMAFSADSKFLCFTSNTETVHVFKIEVPIPKELRLEEEIGLQYEMQDRAAMNPPGWHDYFEQTKRAITDYLAPTRDFAYAILPETANLNVAGLKKVNDSLHILVVISSRRFFVFAISKEGGNCELLRNEKLIPEIIARLK